jgi:hypothetical protein
MKKVGMKFIEVGMGCWLEGFFDGGSFIIVVDTCSGYRSERYV